MRRPQHDFAKWLTETHGKDVCKTPLGGFAYAFAEGFPAEGDRATLRASVEDAVAGSEWERFLLACFDMTWTQYYEHALGDLL